MIDVINKAELELALKNGENNIVINNEKINKALNPLSKMVISESNINRCKYILEKSLDSASFLSSIGFAPMISEIGDVSFLNAMGIISSIGIHEALIIFSKYNIKCKNNKIILSKI